MDRFRFDEMERDPDGNWKVKQPELDFFDGLGAANTVADFVSELGDSLFRDILGSETMDRTLGSFKKEELFQVMARIFLNIGCEKWASNN